MSITIITEIEVSTAALGDVAITAAEGGIGYWSWIISGYNPSRWAGGPDDVLRDNVEVDEFFPFYTIEYENPVDDDPPMLQSVITPHLLAEGLSKLMRSQNVDDIEGMDSADADLVVQYGVFGEQVFG